MSSWSITVAPICERDSLEGATSRVTTDGSHLSRPNVAGFVGELSKIFSICSMISGVNFSTSLSDFTLSSICITSFSLRNTKRRSQGSGLTCETFVAPRMTVLTFSFFTHQAIASWLALPPSFSAISVSFLTFAIFALPSSV